MWRQMEGESKMRPILCIRSVCVLNKATTTRTKQATKERHFLSSGRARSNGQSCDRGARYTTNPMLCQTMLVKARRGKQSTTETAHTSVSE